MADVNMDVECNDPNELYGKGIRALILQNYEAATVTLSKAAELLVAQHNDDMHESLGKVYLDYGKALLGCFREQNEALGDAVPRNASEQSDEDDDEAAEEIDESEENKTEDDEDMKEEEDVSQEEPKETAGEPSQSGSSEEVGASSSKAEGEAEAAEEPNDLEVAWEVLELAKKILKKKGDQKCLAETMIVLGEIQLENEACEKAIEDMNEGLAIQKEIFGKDSRTIAETLYKLGMAYCINSQIKESIQSFEESLEHLTNKIQALETAEVVSQATKEEIDEIKGLIPEIKDKITEMENYKDEALKKAADLVKEASSSATSAPSPSNSKKASDISHLVKRKRKPEEVDKSSEEVTCKKRAVEVENSFG